MGRESTSIAGRAYVRRVEPQLGREKTEPLLTKGLLVAAVHGELGNEWIEIQSLAFYGHHPSAGTRFVKAYDSPALAVLPCALEPDRGDRARRPLIVAHGANGYCASDGVS